MKKIIPLLIIAFLIGVAFYNPKCEHVFTAVEQPVIKGFQVSFDNSKELVCVKCFHMQKQAFEFQPVAFTTDNLDSIRAAIRSVFMGGSSGTVDTTLTTYSIGRVGHLPPDPHITTLERRGGMCCDGRERLKLDSTGMVIIDSTKK